MTSIDHQFHRAQARLKRNAGRPAQLLALPGFQPEFATTRPKSNSERYEQWKQRKESAA